MPTLGGPPSTGPKAHASGRPLRSRVVHWPDARKLATLPGVPEPIVVVDTPNRDEAIVRAALAGSRLVLVPTATSTLELPRVWPILDSAAELGVDDIAVLVRTRRQEPARAAVARDILVSGGPSVTANEIPHRSNLSHASAGVPTSFQLRPFATLVAELGLINNRGGLAT